MLLSMTGFGSASGTVEGVEFSLEMRSVNNRYLKQSIRLPEYLSMLEPEIEKYLRSRMQRGSIMVTLKSRIPEDQAVWSVNGAALEKYLSQLTVLETDANPLLRVDLGTLLQLPGVTEPPPLEQLAEKVKDGVLALLVLATDSLVQMRKTEGEGLAGELLGLCETIDEFRKKISARTPDVVKQYQQRLSQRVEELVGGAKASIDEEYLAREVAIFADRSDIAEELQRLEAHVQQFREIVGRDVPAGRKLDFIAQEMLREANTMGSKANDAEISQHVVEIKTAIDRIKEQVQNVE
ncbi:MAG: YicC/YloC family endoribonuclease [Phycisphaerae bacterium]